jgi:hypothetical protein
LGAVFPRCCRRPAVFPPETARPPERRAGRRPRYAADPHSPHKLRRS